jgi:hypothetical protein
MLLLLPHPEKIQGCHNWSKQLFYSLGGSEEAASHFSSPGFPLM